VIDVVVLGLSETSSIALTGLFDVIAKADAAYGALHGRPVRDNLFDPRLVSLDGQPIRLGQRITVTPDMAAPAVSAVDLVVVPGLNDDLAPSLLLNEPWAPWIAKWHGEGATIASSCSGAFLLAAAGVLDGRAATTHWMYADQLRQRHPQVRVAADRLIIDEGDIITSGGATTFLDLALYLVERFGGHDRANAAARVLLIDGARTSQLPYVHVSGEHRDHDDAAVHQAQTIIDANLAGSLRVDGLAAEVGLSSRTLGRRFEDALGHSPQTYIQLRRVESARRLLECTQEPIGNIQRQVGYSDPTAFRRAFRDHVGLSPSDYRTRFGWRTTSPSPAHTR
jgi:transcriptional regulator GlxA family with amidase domain